MTASLFLADRNLPRYTSYPTAPHFSSAVDAKTYGDWLAAMPRDARLSVYIHIPFCTELCLYCGCNTRAVRKLEPVETYAQRIVDEIALLRILAGRKLTHLHWGGGTPSIVGAHWLDTIVGKIGIIVRRIRDEGARHRTRSAPDRPGACARASDHRRYPRQPRRAGRLHRTSSAPLAASSRSISCNRPPTGCARPVSIVSMLT